MEIDKNSCIGCGACANACPKGIEIKKEKATIKDRSADCLIRAKEVCPVDAIN